MKIARGLLKNQLITTFFFFLRSETASLLRNLSNDHLCRFYYIKAPLQLIHICQMLSELLTGAYCTPGQLEIATRRDSLQHQSSPRLLNDTPPTTTIRQEGVFKRGSHVQEPCRDQEMEKQNGTSASQQNSDSGVRMSPQSAF